MPFSKLTIIFALLCTLAHAAQGERIAQPDLSQFKSVAEAFTMLETHPEATPTHHDGWVIFKLKQNGAYQLWSFTPDSHPAHPAVVKRTIVSHEGKVSIAMQVLCEAADISCDILIAQFEAINEQIKSRFG